jgi:CHAD domain-containing protein
MSVKYNIEKKQTIEDVLKIILFTDFMLLKKAELIAQKMEDSEGVHQMRVSLRKMRSLLTVFKSILPKKVSYFLSDEMRYAGLKLDKARDFDVYIQENFDKTELSYIEKSMFKLAQKNKNKEYKKVTKLIKSKRYKNFQKSLYKWIQSKDWRNTLSKNEQKAFGENIMPFAIDVIKTYQNKLNYFGTDIDKLDDETLHKLRILCKKLRYSTEFFASLFGDNMTNFTNSLKKIQDILGLLHDISVMKELHRILLKRQSKRELFEFAHQLEKKQKQKGEELKKMLLIEWKTFTQINQPWL